MTKTFTGTLILKIKEAYLFILYVIFYIIYKGKHITKTLKYTVSL